MPFPSSQTFLGVAKETTPMTPVASTAYIPILKPVPEDVIGVLTDEGMRGSNVGDYGDFQGNEHSTFDFDGNVHSDTVGWTLGSLLCDVGFTAGPPNVWLMATKNSGDCQPTSLTLNDFYSENNRQYSGAKAAQADFKVAPDTFFTYSAKWVAANSATASTPTSTFTSLVPLTSWRNALKINGTGVNFAEDLTISVKRPVTPIFTARGAQGAYKIFGGKVTCDGTATLVVEDETQIAAYEAGTAFVFDLSATQGAGATLELVEFHGTSAKWVTPTKITRDKDWIQLATTFRLAANTTDVGASGGFSPVAVTLKNALPTGTYQ